MWVEKLKKRGGVVQGGSAVGSGHRQLTRTLATVAWRAGVRACVGGSGGAGAARALGRRGVLQ